MVGYYTGFVDGDGNVITELCNKSFTNKQEAREWADNHKSQYVGPLFVVEVEFKKLVDLVIMEFVG